MVQVTETQSPRKLNRRLDEERFAQVKGYLLAVQTFQGNVVSDMPYDARSLLLLKSVKENADMVAILREIGEYLDVGNLDAAKAVVKRVFEVPAAISLGSHRPGEGASA